MSEIRIALTRSDFRKLVRGEVIEHEADRQETAVAMLSDKQPLTVRIILQDIGFNTMEDEVAEARRQ